MAWSTDLGCGGVLPPTSGTCPGESKPARWPLYAPGDARGSLTSNAPTREFGPEAAYRGILLRGGYAVDVSMRGGPLLPSARGNVHLALAGRAALTSLMLGAAARPASTIRGEGASVAPNACWTRAYTQISPPVHPEPPTRPGRRATVYRVAPHHPGDRALSAASTAVPITSNGVSASPSGACVPYDPTRRHRDVEAFEVSSLVFRRSTTRRPS